MQLNINGTTIEVSNDDLKKALEENKETLELKPEGIILRTEEADTTLSDNLRKEGIATGAEIGRKEVLKGLGIEGEGLHKTDVKSIESINTFISGKVADGLKDAKVEPNKKVESLTKDLQTLQGTIATLTGERDNALSNHESFKTNLKMEKDVLKAIPDNTVVPKDAMLKLIMSDMSFGVENGITFGMGADGQPMKDATLSLLPVEKVVSGYLDNNPHYLKTASGGGGGDDSSGAGGKQSMEAFIKEMGDAGHSPNSEGFNKVLTDRVTAGTLNLD